jgi:UDP-3-O-[3-hydroxymyristoyl] glucosamine N-acyltransferase
MADPRFFSNAGPLSIAQILGMSGAKLVEESISDDERVIRDVAPLDRAGIDDISFLDNIKYTDVLSTSRAGACFVRPKYAERAPSSMLVLLSEEPYRCFALVAQHFYPAYALAKVVSPHAHIASSVKLGKGCTIEAGAVISDRAEIGHNCYIGQNAVIHAGVVIGDDTHIGACSTLSHCILGRHIIVHRGVHIGQDGFGFALGREGHIKVPQLGRVIIEDNVEIGSGTCIDRGTGPDTVIGEGSKIDNLVQIGHNVHIGRHSIIVAQVGIAGSSRIGDGVMLGGQSGIAGHLKIGSGVRLAAQSGVMNDIPAGTSYGGSPAVPSSDWHRQTVAIARLARKRGTEDE